VKRYLILIPLIIGLFSLKFFSMACAEVQTEKYHQKFHDIHTPIDLIATQIGLFNTTDPQYEKYIKSVKEQITFVDSEYMVFAAIYNYHLELESKRVLYNEPAFDPFAYDNLVNALNNNHGEMELSYNRNSKGSVYYKWVTTADGHDRYLLMAFVSLNAPLDNFATWIIYGTLTLIALIVVMQIWLIMKGSRLADVVQGGGIE